MKIRKYFAADMRQALNLARQEQGPEVVILGNRKVLGGVELIAAEEYDESLFVSEDLPSEVKQDVTANIIEEIVDDGRDLPPERPAPEPRQDANSALIWSKQPSLDKVQQEINSLRSLLEQQMSGLAWGEVGRRHPLWAGLLRRLGQLDINPAIAKRLVEQVPEDYQFEQAWRTTLALLSYEIPVQQDNILAEGHSIAFLGASGTGKTTTIAKLATRHVLEKGTNNIVLATLDSYRVGGKEQLRSYAKILGIPLRVINSGTDLNDLLEQFHQRKLILLDTAGLSPKDARYREQISLLQQASRPIHHMLVFPANSQLPALQQSIDTYRLLRPGSCVITKLDETNSLGSVLSVVMQQKFKVAYQCNGQKVPEDIKQAEATDLIACAVSMMKRNQNDYDEEGIEQSYGKHVVHHPIGQSYEH